MAITLEEALNKVLDNNLQILMGKEKIREAEQILKVASAAYFPILNLDGVYTHLGEVSTGEQDVASFIFSLTQPLYTSGRLSLTKQQIEVNYQTVKQDLENIQKEVAYQVKEGFYSYFLAEKNLEIIEKALEQAELHLKVVESFFQSGRVSRFDFLRAKVEIANLKPELIQAKNSLYLAKEKLAFLLSLPSSSFEVEGKLKFEVLTLTLNQAIKDALTSRSDLKSWESQKDMAKLFWEIAKANNLPTLSFIANYEFTPIGEKGWQDNWNANIVLSFPLFDSGRNKAVVEQKKSQVIQTELAIQQLRGAIQIEVKKAFLDMQAAKESLIAQEQNIYQAEEALFIAKARYESGTIIQLEVLDAQLALTRARAGYNKALFDYNLARAHLDRAIGIKEESSERNL